MTDEVQSLVLNNALGEIKNICPEVSHIFIFKNNSKILAKDENTDEETTKNTVEAFEALAERSSVIGGIESLNFKANEGGVNITRVDEDYMISVTSNEADEKYLNALTRVLVSNLLRLADKIYPISSISENKSEPEPLDEETAKDNSEEEPEADNSEEETLTEDFEPNGEKPVLTLPTETILPEPPVNQLIVDDLHGLRFLGSSNTVRIDSATILLWKDLYGNRQIEEVVVKTFNGKAARCRFKSTKGSEYDGKGIIQLPEQVQLALQTRKGDLVTVKPLIE
jgi:hypothetical protein